MLALPYLSALVLVAAAFGLLSGWVLVNLWLLAWPWAGQPWVLAWQAVAYLWQ